MHYMYIRSWTSLAYAANDSCVACSDVAAKRNDHPRRATCDPCLDSQRGSECIGAATCECSGGERGRALMCPAEGYFLVVDQAKEALIDPEGKASEWFSARRTRQNQLHDAFKVPPHDASLCTEPSLSLIACCSSADEVPEGAA